MIELGRLRFLLAAGCASSACTETAPDYCRELRGSADASGGVAGGDGTQSEAGCPSGASGASGAGSASRGGGAEPPSRAAAQLSDEYVTGVEVTVHPQVRTILVVTWTQVLPAEEVWLEFTFEGGEAGRSRRMPGNVGMHREVILGVPAETAVTFQVVAGVGATDDISSNYAGATGALPGGMPVPEVFAYDPARTSPERWLFGSVEDSNGGRDAGYYLNTFWLYIMDRSHRLVLRGTGQQRDLVVSAGRARWRVHLDREALLQPSRTAKCGEDDAGPRVFRRDPGARLVRQHRRDRPRQPAVRRGERAPRTIAERSGAARLELPAAFRPGFLLLHEHRQLAPGGRQRLAFISLREHRRGDRSRERRGRRPVRRGAGKLAVRPPPLSVPPEAWSFSFQHFPNRTPTGTLLVSSRHAAG